MTAYVRRINHVLINVHKIFVIISTMYQYLKLYKIILFSIKLEIFMQDLLQCQTGWIKERRI